MRTILLVLAAGVAGGLLLLGWRASAGDTARAAEAPRALGAGPRDDRPRSLEAGVAATDDDAARAAIAGDEELDAAEAPATDAADDHDAAEATPVLVGRAVDLGGEPLPDAEVHAISGGWGGAAPLEMEPVGEVGSLPRALARTDADGRFELEGDLRREGAVQLAVVADGYATARRDEIRLPETLPVDVGDVALEPGSVVRGRVVDRAGEGVAGTAVLLAIVRGEQGIAMGFPGRGIPLGTTDEDGAFEVDRLAPGGYTLLFDAPGFLVATHTGEAAFAGDVEEGVVVPLERGASIAGRVEGVPPDAGALRVEARVRRDEEGRSDGERRAAWRSGGAAFRPRVGELDDSGAFRIGGLPADAGVSLVVTTDRPPAWRRTSAGGEGWRRVPEVEPVEAWPGTRDVVLEWRARATLRLRAVDAATGAPVESLVAWHGDDEDGDEDWQVLRAPRSPGADWSEGVRLVHPGGVVRFEDVAVDPDRPRRRVRLRALGSEQEVLEGALLARGRTTDLGDVPLTPAPVVRVRVVDDADGEPIAGARVLLAPRGERSTRFWLERGVAAWAVDDVRYGETDAEGRAVVGALDEPGELYATTEVHRPNEPIDVAPGGVEEPLEVRLSLGATLVARAVLPDGAPADAVVVECRPFVPPNERNGRRGRRLDFGGGRAERRTTDGRGVARFARLEPGPYEVRVQRESSVARVEGVDPDTLWVDVELAASESREVVLEAPGRVLVTGTVLELGEPLADANVVFAPAGQESDGRWGRDALAATTDGAGRFSVDGIVPGAWDVVITHRDRGTAARVEAQVGPRGAELEIDLDVSIVEGVVVDAEGDPRPGVSIQVIGRGGGWGGWVGGAVLVEGDDGDVDREWDGAAVGRSRTDAEGRFRFRGVAPGVPLIFQTQGELLLPARVEVAALAPGEVRRGVTVRVEDAGRVRVALEGDRRGRWTVAALRLREDGEPHPRDRGRRTRIWPGATRTLGSLASGRYRVELLPSNGRGETLDARVVDVRAGGTSEVSFRVD